MRWAGLPNLKMVRNYNKMTDEIVIWPSQLSYFCRLKQALTAQLNWHWIFHLLELLSNVDGISLMNSREAF